MSRYSFSGRRQRAAAHARHTFYCQCGKVVHGNGGKANHFFVNGDRYQGKREGHRGISRDAFFELFPDWRPE